MRVVALTHVHVTHTHGTHSSHVVHVAHVIHTNSHAHVHVRHHHTTSTTVVLETSTHVAAHHAASVVEASHTIVESPHHIVVEVASHRSSVEPAHHVHLGVVEATATHTTHVHASIHVVHTATVVATATATETSTRLEGRSIVVRTRGDHLVALWCILRRSLERIVIRSYVDASVFLDILLVCAERVDTMFECRCGLRRRKLNKGFSDSRYQLRNFASRHKKELTLCFFRSPYVR